MLLQISPFSLEHNWTINWHRLPSNIKERPILGEIAKNEEKALYAIASVGVITSSQMYHLFNLNKTKLKKMVARQRIVRHELILNEKHKISIYTLGINGAKIVRLSGYEINYWVRYQITDVIKRLLFFSLLERFKDKNAEVMPAPEPFAGGLVINEKPMYVYVVRGDVTDLIMFIKWNEFHERMIIVTESLSVLAQLKPYLNNIKLRVILDHSIVDKNSDISKAFYLFKDNEFIPEV